MNPFKKFSTKTLVLTLALCSGFVFLQGSQAFADESYFVDFGFVHINTPQSRYFTITNTGPDVLTLKKFEASGPGFDGETNCDHALAVNAKCTLRIDFQPVFEGLQTGDLDLDFDHDSMHFTLQGQGTRN